MRGRKQTPTKLKELHGNPGKRGLPKHEPDPTPVTQAELPPVPSHFGEEAAAEWHRIVGEYSSLGLLTILDIGLLAAYCVAYGRWVESERIVREKGAVVKTIAGNLIQNPYLAIANKAIEQMIKIGIEFGMTPASRPRMGRDAAMGLPAPSSGVANAGAAQGDDLDRFLDQHPDRTLN